MVAAGICHSDYHIVVGDLPSYLPLALGHEGAGIVEVPLAPVSPTASPATMSFSPLSLRVGIAAIVRRVTNLCNMGAAILMGPQLDGTFRMHGESGDVGQMRVISTFSENKRRPRYVRRSHPRLHPLNRAVLVGCGVPTGVGAAIHRARVQAGSTVMVIGCGGIGMNTVQGAAIAGARMVIAVDVNDFKLEKAKEFGATHTINSTREDPVAISRDLTWGEGVDYAFEAIATPATIGQAYACTGKNGTVCVIGLTPATAESIPISPLDLVLSQKTIMGTLYGDSQPRFDILNLLKMYGAGKLKLDELVTRTYTLDQVNEAYADMVGGKNIRGVIQF